MARAIARISYEILERNRGVEDLCVIGLLTRGADIAARIARKIQEVEGIAVEVGCLDITPYRDDRPGGKEEGRTRIPFSVGNKRVVLVDDVIYTGRSARAAMDAVMARGRPRAVQLAVLIDRGHRELPIRADFVGKNVPTSREELVQVMVSETDGCDKVLICER